MNHNDRFPSPTVQLTELFLEFVKTYDNDSSRDVDFCLDNLYRNFRKTMKEVRTYCPRHIQFKFIDPRTDLMRRVFIALVTRGYPYLCWFIYQEPAKRCIVPRSLMRRAQWFIDWQDEIQNGPPSDESLPMPMPSPLDHEALDDDDPRDYHNMEYEMMTQNVDDSESYLGESGSQADSNEDSSGNDLENDSQSEDDDEDDAEGDTEDDAEAKYIKAYQSQDACLRRHINSSLDEAERWYDIPHTTDPVFVARRDVIIQRYETVQQQITDINALDRSEANPYQNQETNGFSERLGVLSKRLRSLDRQRDVLQVDILRSRMRQQPGANEEYEVPREGSRAALIQNVKDMVFIILPRSAREKNPIQKKWPGAAQEPLDIWFGRFLLDKVTRGTGRHESHGNFDPDATDFPQLKDIMRVCDQILSGDANLVAMIREFNASQAQRQSSVTNNPHRIETGGQSATETEQVSPRENFQPLSRRAEKLPEALASAKRDHPDVEESDGGEDQVLQAMRASKRLKTILSQPGPSTASSSSAQQNLAPLTNPDPTLVSRIADSQLTNFQKLVLTALLHIPRGRWTTYGALARHLDSSPRAVGNALRNNPFAPEVPCHRVVATDRTVGGFKGDWGKNGAKGRFEEEKVALLQTEDVIFDDRGKVMGQLWSAW